jgi:hypothetical protein
VNMKTKTTITTIPMKRQAVMTTLMRSSFEKPYHPVHYSWSLHGLV